jgi:hypothetical protein
MFSIFGYFLFLFFASTFGQEGVEKALRKLRDSVDRFEANFHRAIDDYGKTSTIRAVSNLKFIFELKQLNEY